MPDQLSGLYGDLLEGSYDCVDSLTALLVLREKIIKPLLAASNQPDPPSQVNPTPIDRHYENLRAGMRDLFMHFGMTA